MQIPKPMPVCIVEHGTSGGGSFESMSALVTHLDRERYAPMIVSVNETPQIVALRAAGFPTYVITDSLYSTAAPYSSRWIAAALVRGGQRWQRTAVRADAVAHRAAARALIERMRADRTALLHTNNNPIRDAYAIDAARQLGIPVVAHLRSVRVGAIPQSLAQLLRRSIAHAIANSAYAASWWTAQLGLSGDRVSVIPNPVARDPVAAIDVHAVWGIPHAAHTIACVANFVAGKGHRLLLEAFARVRGEMSTAYLLCAGDGALRADAAAHARALGIAGMVRFIGYAPNARAIMAGCDVLAVPSETETFGRIIVEAMGVGTPVVATRVGGIPELIRNGENGLLVPSGDAAALAAALVRILRDRALAHTLRVGGRATVATGAFDPSVHAARVSAVYDEVCTRIPA